MPDSEHGSTRDIGPTKLAAPGAHSRWVAVVVLAGLAMMVARRPDGARGLYLWAEDGTRFMTNAFHLGGASLLEPYIGQLSMAKLRSPLVANWKSPPFADVQLVLSRVPPFALACRMR